MTKNLTRDEIIQHIETAFKTHHPVRWVFSGDKILSPDIQISSTSRYNIAIHTDSRWWPLVSVESMHFQGITRFWWPFGRIPTFLRERIGDRERERLEQRKRLLMSLKRVQKWRRLR